LQVNLRCMQKNPQGYTVYVGGGITADSDPQQEWDETIAKAQTMLKAIWGLLKNSLIFVTLCLKKYKSKAYL